MRKRLIKIGKSLALVIDRPLLDRLGIGAETEVDIDVFEERALMIQPVLEEPSTHEEFEEHLRQRAMDVLMQIRREHLDPVSPDVAAELENLQRLVQLHVDARDLDQTHDPGAVADETTFRPGKTVRANLADNYLGRVLAALRPTKRASTPEVEQSSARLNLGAARYRLPRRR